jgi:hypothetical protein
MDAVLDYYNKTPQVSLGSETPTINPELIVSALENLKRQSLPTPAPTPTPAQSQPSSSYEDRVKKQQAEGMGMQIPSQQINLEFPEYAHTSKKTNIDQSRVRQQTRKLQELSKYVNAPEHVFKQLEKIYDEEINVYYPKIEDFDKANPRVEELRKEITPLVQKRNGWISSLASYASQADESTMLPGESEKDWAQRISPTLLAQLKLYNTALAGSSDALSTQEVDRLTGGQLPDKYFSVGNLLRANADVTKGNIKAFQSKLQQLHDILLNQTNDAFNTLAAQSSPKYATQALGYAQSNFLSPENAVRQSVRMDDTADAKVIRGQQTMAQMFLLKKEEYVKKETDDALRAIEQGYSKEAVKQMFKEKTGKDLKLVN